MVAIGMALIWGGYTIGIWGYCLVNGYDVPFTSLFGTSWKSAAQSQAPVQVPPSSPGTGVFQV